MSFILKANNWKKFAVITSSTFTVNMILGQALDYYTANGYLGKRAKPVWKE